MQKTYPTIYLIMSWFVDIINKSSNEKLQKKHTGAYKS